jgi:hypothetical protein
MNTLHKTLRVAAALCPLVTALSQSPGDNMRCVTEMEVPRYSWIARGAIQDTGTVDIDFRIGAGGVYEDIQASSPDPRLLKEVESFLKIGAKFSPSCGGKRVHMLFTFQMEGDPTPYPFTRVRFRPPNHFIITSQRTPPGVDYMPVKPEEETPKP